MRLIRAFLQRLVTLRNAVVEVFVGRDERIVVIEIGGAALAVALGGGQSAGRQRR